MTEQEKVQQKRDAAQLASYKKKLRENNEVKRLQVEELELNLKFYEYKRKWLDIQDDILKLEKDEDAHIKKQQEEARKEREKLIKKMEEAKKGTVKEEPQAEKPEIVLPKQGKPREK